MIPWIEKYRPNTIENIYGSDIKKKLYEMKKTTLFQISYVLDHQELVKLHLY